MPYPTNPSYVRRVLMATGKYQQVKVTPSNDVSVKIDGKWSSLGTTQSILCAAEAAHKARYGKDAEKLGAAK